MTFRMGGHANHEHHWGKRSSRKLGGNDGKRWGQLLKGEKKGAHLNAAILARGWNGGNRLTVGRRQTEVICSSCAQKVVHITHNIKKGKKGKRINGGEWEIQLGAKI